MAYDPTDYYGQVKINSRWHFQLGADNESLRNHKWAAKLNAVHYHRRGGGPDLRKNGAKIINKDVQRCHEINLGITRHTPPGLEVVRWKEPSSPIRANEEYISFYLLNDRGSYLSKTWAEEHGEFWYGEEEIHAVYQWRKPGKMMTKAWANNFMKEYGLVAR